MAVLRAVPLFLFLVFLCLSFVPLRVLSKRLAQRWAWYGYGVLLRILSISTSVQGKKDARAQMLVCNHTSYLDILILGNALNVPFVSKAEVAKWPFVGWVARGMDTFFVTRHRARVAAEVKKLTKTLGKGRPPILFAEGTSGDGINVLPFKSGFFPTPDEDGDVYIQPVSLLLTSLNGFPAPAFIKKSYGWRGDQSLMEHVILLLRLGAFQAKVVLHPVVQAKGFQTRAELASAVRTAVAKPFQVAAA